MTFEDITQSYQVRKLALPKSEIKYQETLQIENQRFRDTENAIKEIYKQETDNITNAKKTAVLT